MKKLLAASFLFITCYTLTAQDQPDLQKLLPKRFIDKWEAFVGSNWNIPDDHGFSDYYRSISQNAMTYEFKTKAGYSFGIGLTHSFSDRFDIVGRIFYDRRSYNQENTASYPNRFISSVDEISNDYATLSLIPRFWYRKKLYIGLGISYGKEIKYIDKFTQYINGQLNGQSIITNTSNLNLNILDIVSCVGYSVNVKNNNWIAIQISPSYGLLDLYNANKLRLTSNCVYASLIFIHQRKKITLPINQ